MRVRILQGLQHASVVQLVECRSPKPMVSGSSPDGRAKGDIAQLVEQWIENPCVTGSIPVITTTLRGLVGKNFLS